MYEGHPIILRRIVLGLIEKHGVSVFYTAPTAIGLHEVDMSTRQGTISRRCDCSGTVGEPINPAAWMWYHEHIGHGKCPIVDTWWQTETGGIMISPLPGITSTRPGSATHPLPGIDVAVLDEAGTKSRPAVADY